MLVALTALHIVAGLALLTSFHAFVSVPRLLSLTHFHTVRMSSADESSSGMIYGSDISLILAVITVASLAGGVWTVLKSNSSDQKTTSTEMASIKKVRQSQCPI